MNYLVPQTISDDTPRDFHETLASQPSVEEISAALRNWLSVSTLPTETFHDWIDEIFINMYVSPNMDYIYHRLQIFNTLRDIINENIRNAENNKNSLILGLQKISGFVSKNTDLGIRNQIKSTYETELLYQVIESGHSKELIGMKCGVIGAGRNHEGIILKIEEGNLLRGSIFIVDCFLLGVQKVPLMGIYIPQSSYPVEIPVIKKAYMLKILSKFNDVVNTERRNLQSIISSEESNINSYREKITLSEDRIKRSEEKLEGIKETSIDENYLKDILKQISSHKMVEQAYLDEGGRINVITKKLGYVKGKKVTKYVIGRMYFVIDPVRADFHVYNLDYATLYEDDGWDNNEELFHPLRISNYHMNITSGGDVCQGEQTNAFRDYLKNFDLYLFVDLLIEFLSVEHNEDADPYITASAFFKEKKKIPTDLQVKINEPIEI